MASSHGVGYEGGGAVVGVGAVIFGIAAGVKPKTTALTTTDPFWLSIAVVALGVMILLAVAIHHGWSWWKRRRIRGAPGASDPHPAAGFVVPDFVAGLPAGAKYSASAWAPASPGDPYVVKAEIIPPTAPPAPAPEPSLRFNAGESGWVQTFPGGGASGMSAEGKKVRQAYLFQIRVDNVSTVAAERARARLISTAPKATGLPRDLHWQTPVVFPPTSELDIAPDGHQLAELAKYYSFEDGTESVIGLLQLPIKVNLEAWQWDTPHDSLSLDVDRPWLAV